MIESFLAVNQPLNLAEAGNRVEVVFEVQLMEEEGVESSEFVIERGGLGATWVELYRLVGGEWVQIESFTWAGHGTGERNIATFEVESEVLFGALP
jgi:hypothetical protein